MVGIIQRDRLDEKNTKSDAEQGIQSSIYFCSKNTWENRKTSQNWNRKFASMIFRQSTLATKDLKKVNHVCLVG